MDLGWIGIGLGKRGAGRSGFGLGRHKLQARKKVDDDGCRRCASKQVCRYPRFKSSRFVPMTQEAMWASLKGDVLFFFF